MLEVANLSLAYGQHRALDDVSLNVGARRDRDDPRRQRRRQDHAAEGHRRRRAAASGQQVTPRRPRYLGDCRPHEIVEGGLALVPEGRGIFGDLTVQRKPRCSAPTRSAPATAKRRNRDQVLELFPRLRERARPDRAHHERRRAADGRDRPRADVRRRTSCCSTSPRSGSRRSCAASCSRRLRRVREAGVGILLVEQNARQSLRDRRPRLSDRDRPHRRPRQPPII